MKAFLHRSLETVMSWVTLAFFLCLFVVGLILFSWLLAVIAIVMLAITAAFYLRARITLFKYEKNTHQPDRKKHTGGHVIDHKE